MERVPTGLTRFRIVLVVSTLTLTLSRLTGEGFALTLTLSHPMGEGELLSK